MTHAAKSVDVRGPQGWPAKVIRVHPGDIVVVHLSEQAGSTGYAWHIAGPNSSLKLIDEKIGKPVSDAIGAPYDHAFRFKVTQAGTAQARFRLTRATSDTAKELTLKVQA